MWALCFVDDESCRYSILVALLFLPRGIPLTLSCLYVSLDTEQEDAQSSNKYSMAFLVCFFFFSVFGALNVVQLSYNMGH